MTAMIRPARPGDEPDILRLIRALADYERDPDAVEATVDGLRAHLFADEPRVFAHVAEQDGRIVGIAVWFLTFSTWTGRHGIYLEDLFVEPSARGAGIARELMRALAAEARDKGYRRMDWAVLDWNEPAKTFYRRLGARHNETWELWRVDGDALAALAGPAPTAAVTTPGPPGPPRGYHSLTPRIVVDDVAAQVTFLEAAFGATGAASDGRPAEVRIGDSLVLVSSTGARDRHPAFLYVYVDDADATYRQAVDAGATTLEAPLDTPYGDRRAMVRDPFGNVFQIAHPIDTERAGRVGTT